MRILWPILSAGQLAFPGFGNALAQVAVPLGLPRIQLAPAAASDGETAAGGSGAAIFSGGGRFAIFLSDADNLVTNDVPSGFTDVFRRDLILGSTTLVSVGASMGTGGHGSVTAFSASADGRWVAFSSRASNLVAGDANEAEDVFLRDLDTGVTRLVSRTPEGLPGNGESLVPLISGDGRWVLFESAATNLTAMTDTNRTYDVFLWDREADGIRLVSLGLDGVAGSGASNAEVLSRNGDRVVFRSLATNLVPIGSGIETDLLVWTRSSGVVRRMELPGPKPSDVSGPVAAYNPVLSSDGRRLAFRTKVSGSATSAADGVWWVDLEEQTPAVRVSGDLYVGRPVGRTDASGPAISEDGRIVAFEAQAQSAESPRIRIWTLTGGLQSLDEFVTGELPRLPEPSRSWSPVFSPDGKSLVFQTDLAVPAAGVGSPGGMRFYVRVLATGETKTLFPDLALDISLPAPVFSPDGTALLFQTAAVLPGVRDVNRASDVLLTPVTMDRIEVVSRRHPDRAAQVGAGSSWLGAGSLSDDGRWLVFTSAADNLVSNDENGRRDVFARDLSSGTNLLVSVGFDGKAPAADSWQPRISADGRRVVFVSMATNLVAGPMQPFRSVYVRDLPSGTTVLASARDASDLQGSHAAFNPQISADGESVTFESASTNLVLGTSTNQTRLFLRHLRSRRTTLVSGSLARSEAMEHREAPSFFASMDATGSRVAFLGGLEAHLFTVADGSTRRITAGIRPAAFSLSRDGTRMAFQGNLRTSFNLRAVYWRDLSAETNHLIVATSPSSGVRFANVSISADGRVVAFESDIVPPESTDTNATNDVFAFDIPSGTLSRVSTALVGGAAGNGASDSPVLTADGRWLVFRSISSNLVADDTNNATDVFIADRVTGAVTRLSRRLSEGMSESVRIASPLVSGDGAVVAFRSRAADIVSGDYNGAGDVFAVRSSSPPLLLLTDAMLVSEGRLRLAIVGVTGSRVAIEFSQDLVKWESMSTHTVPGSLEIVIPTASGSAFYRAVVQP